MRRIKSENQARFGEDSYVLRNRLGREILFPYFGEYFRSGEEPEQLQEARFRA